MDKTRASFLAIVALVLLVIAAAQRASHPPAPATSPPRVSTSHPTSSSVHGLQETLRSYRPPGGCRQLMPFYYMSWQQNFGDVLNVDLGAALLGLDRPARGAADSRRTPGVLWVTTKHGAQGKVVAIGSVLNQVQPGDVVAGPGYYSFQTPNAALLALRGNATLLAVRGPISCAALRARGVDACATDPLYLDPGLIVPAIAWPGLVGRGPAKHGPACVLRLALQGHAPCTGCFSLSSA